MMRHIQLLIAWFALAAARRLQHEGDIDGCRSGISLAYRAMDAAASDSAEEQRLTTALLNLSREIGLVYFAKPVS